MYLGWLLILSMLVKGHHVSEGRNHGRVSEYISLQVEPVDLVCAMYIPVNPTTETLHDLGLNQMRAC